MQNIFISFIFIILALLNTDSIRREFFLVNYARFCKIIVVTPVPVLTCFVVKKLLYHWKSPHQSFILIHTIDPCYQILAVVDKFTQQVRKVLPEFAIVFSKYDVSA